MIIYVAPDDNKLYKRTLTYAQGKSISMWTIDQSKLLSEEVNKAKSFRYLNGGYNFGDAETVWVVGHGNERVIGDKSNSGVTLNAEDLAAIIKAVAINRKYKGAIVIDTCKSGVKNDSLSFADAAYKSLKNDFTNIHVGGWKGSVSGPIGGGQVELSPNWFVKEAGFAWGGGKVPGTEAHEILAKLA
jgi:hypothetical protein